MTQPKDKPPPGPPPRPKKPPSVPGPTRLKVVTVSPGRSSFADTELSTGQQRLGRQDPYLGATIDGRYKVEAVLGQGGMGVVYRCTHTIIGKKVAMKVLRADLAREAEVTERFLNEAKAAGAIGNPHIIDISDFGQLPDGATYFIMEYLGGSSLAKAIEGNRPMPVERILSVARQLAEGLADAHAAGIVHRDLKPDNIFLIDRGGQKDFVKILDFGIAKVSTGEEGKLTRAGTVFGTPHYMSPEQAAGAPVDHRGDIYSLGVIFYELACGRVPFEADNFMGILTQHMYKTPAPLRELVPGGVSPEFEAVVLKCLCKRPEERYQSMEELLGDVDRLRGGAVPEAVRDMTNRSRPFNLPPDYFEKSGNLEPSSRTAPELTSSRRWPLIAGVAGAAFIAGSSLVLYRSRSADIANEGTLQPITPDRAPRAASPMPTPRIAELPTPELRRVVVAAEPLDAHIYRGDEDLGPSPVMIPLKSGEQAHLVARRSGYKDASITVDGSSPRAVIKLEKSATGARPQSRQKGPSRSDAPKQAPVDTGEIVNPWK